MAEGITQSESEYATNSILEKHTLSEQSIDNAESTPLITSSISQAHPIWTPRFIILFALTLVLGLSATSLLTQGYSNHFFAGEAILLVDCGLVFAAWLTIAIVSRSPWARLGGIFACSWTLFTSVNFVASLLNAPPGAAISTHATAAASLALFASYLCFSINRTPLARWDHWFLRIAPVLAGAIVIASYIFTPRGTRSVHDLETSLAITILYLSIFTWWLRPSCWKSQPGVALLLGIAPIFVLLTTTLYAFSDETGLSYLQISLVFFLLAALRILQGELRLRGPLTAKRLLKGL
jgi:hypothetical protein